MSCGLLYGIGLTIMFQRFGLLAFVKRQQWNYRVLLIRRAAEGFFLRLSHQYTSLFARALGADPVQLGLLFGTGNAVNMAVSIPTGWMIDRYSLRKLILFGMIIETLVPLAYALAWDLRLVLVAIILSSITSMGGGITYEIDRVYLASSLRDKDRATGFGMSDTLGTIPSLIVPMIAAFIVMSSGGINAGGIRPLFYMQLAGLCPLCVAIYLLLKEPATKGDVGTGSFFKDFLEVFEGETALKTYIFMEVLGGLIWGMSFTFATLYAVEVKGATPLILGYMGIASSLSQLTFSAPIGRLADKIGRKKAIYVTRPIYYATLLILVLAQAPEYLILAWICLGFPFERMVFDTMCMEMVPEKKRGRWMALVLFFRSLARIPAPVLGGILYTSISPEAPFLTALLIDLLIKIPILHFGIPETSAHRTVLQTTNEPPSTPDTRKSSR